MVESRLLTCTSYNTYNTDLDEDMELLSYSSQLSMKFILLINVKMPTSVGILTFKRGLNTTSGCLNKTNLFKHNNNNNNNKVLEYASSQYISLISSGLETIPIKMLTLLH